MVTPWVFAVTPPGWSSVVDGYHLPSLDGMRGVISTDIFHGIGHVSQFYKQGEITIKRSALLERVLPVPRQLLQADYNAVF
jgi:hypothetical protein